MEALALAVALLTVDAEVRQSPEYALYGQLSVFPNPDLLQRDKKLANEHLDWLKAMLELGPSHNFIRQEHVDQQKAVVRLYDTLEAARYWNRETFRHLADESIDNETGEDVECYGAFCARMARDTADSLRDRLGFQDFFFGRLPPPLPCMEQP